MNDDLFRQDEYDEEPNAGRDNLFLWTVGILLLLGLAFTSWLGSYYIFGHPEKPESYRILQKLKKLDPPKRFELTKAPPGEFLSPQKAYERYAKMSPFELGKENEGLLRDYIKNYQSTKRLVPYLTGRYTIMDSYLLGENDFFKSGVVAVAQSVDFPQVVVEHIYTAPPDGVDVLKQTLATGLDITLERLSDLAAVMHVSRMADGRLRFTVVPLLYGSYALKQGTGNFDLEPPSVLNPGAGLPVVKGKELDDAIAAYGAHHNKRYPSASPGGTPAIPVAVSVAETTIVRVATPTPAKTPLPEPEPKIGAPEPTAPAAVAVAQAEPASPAVPVISNEEEPPAAQPATTLTLPNTAAARPTPATPPPAASPAAAATTPPSTAAATPLLQPFLAAAPAPGSAPAAGKWQTYSPGKMPRGRLVSLSEASDLAQRSLGGERIYLKGSFTVTASGESKAVLRPTGNALNNVLGRQANARVIVDFPAGSQPPRELSSLSRDESRPFEIREIRRGNDGQINIYVREITTP